MFLTIKEICKDKCPMKLEKLISYIQIETGLSKIKVKEYVKVLFDTDVIKISETDLEVTCGDPK